MTTEVDIVNRALQGVGTRTTVTQAELDNQTSNEAIQASLIFRQLRDETLRMAPWDCATAFAPLTYITSTPGTPENVAASTPLWVRGQPAPPWAYEYQYPIDCLRVLYIVPQFQSGFQSGVPITNAVTGGAASFWQGPPVKFKVSTDLFFSITDFVNINTGGTGHVVGDIITFPYGPSDLPPIGAPAQVIVTAVNVGGVITAVDLTDQVAGEQFSRTGSYFAKQASPIPQDTTTGVGVGASFTVPNDSWLQSPQRVILTNQEFALCAYIKQITDPNVMDPLFQQAWVAILAARLTMALVGDKQLANIKIQEANTAVMEARKVDGNEGLTVNDITPDWIRTRGIFYSDYSYTPNVDYSWGSLWTPF